MEQSRFRPPSTKYHFYERPLGVLLLAGIAFIFFLVIFVGFKVFYYYKKIKLGEIVGNYQGRLTQGRFIPPERPKEKLALSAEDDPSFGPKEAPIQIIGFSDFECPYSRDFAFSLRELMIKYPNRFNFIFRDFPLIEIHPNSFRAAEAANCAAEQGKFWPMHDKLFQNQERLSDLDLKLYALQIGLDMVKFNQCFDGHKYKEEIEIDLADGKAAGVIGTPTFYINGVKVEGAIPKEGLEKIILSR